MQANSCHYKLFYILLFVCLNLKIVEREGKNYKNLNISRTKRAFFIKQKTVFKISRRVKKKMDASFKDSI